ncbi:MAG TPA: KOW motif-containing protein [Candidatus Nanoarchaeia archaeon]|nr:KOW motif-containing protein [Candidatus Nanoarchaeia archaeon]
MTHLKRKSIPKEWPMSRKGSTFVAKNISKGVPILVVIRDIMKIARNRKEVKKAIHMKHLLVSNRIVNDEKKSMELFDTLTIIPSKKNYQLILSEHGKYDVKEISEKETKEKISKIIDKKIVKGKKSQLNLWDGRNYLSDIKCQVNDSVLIDLEKNKILKCLPLKEKCEVLIIGGKHAGDKGVVKRIDLEEKMVEVKTKDEQFNVLIKQIMVTK